MADESALVLKALSRIDELSAEIRNLQMFVNQADMLEGKSARFDTGTPLSCSPISLGAPKAEKQWRPGVFFQKPLATAVRLILLARYEAAGNEANPASVDHLHDALTQGSFDFDTSGTEQQKNSIRISLGKNSVSFVKLPNSDLFGLVEWYGAKNRRATPAKKPTNGDKTEEPDTADAAPQPSENGGLGK
ncbi:MAG TPA: hypothetical protein VFW28_10905 [Micropepsaceae bacterium]|nr:hypothetical protein [Micropepsaceae bacterium]